MSLQMADQMWEVGYGGFYTRWVLNGLKGLAIWIRNLNCSHVSKIGQAKRYRSFHVYFIDQPQEKEQKNIDPVNPCQLYSFSFSKHESNSSVAYLISPFLWDQTIIHMWISDNCGAPKPLGCIILYPQLEFPVNFPISNSGIIHIEYHIAGQIPLFP